MSGESHPENLEVPAVAEQVDSAFQPSVLLRGLVEAGEDLVDDPNLTQSRVDNYVQTSNELLEQSHEEQGGDGRVNVAGKAVFYNRDENGQATSISYGDPNSPHRRWRHELLITRRYDPSEQPSPPETDER